MYTVLYIITAAIVAAYIVFQEDGLATAIVCSFLTFLLIALDSSRQKLQDKIRFLQVENEEREREIRAVEVELLELKKHNGIESS